MSWTFLVSFFSLCAFGSLGCWSVVDCLGDGRWILVCGCGASFSGSGI